MKKLVVTDDYLFYEKRYPKRKQIGIQNPAALWNRMYKIAQKEHPVDDAEHKRIANEECRVNYGFYYKTVGSTSKREKVEISDTSDYEDRVWQREMADIIGHDQSW